MEFFQESCFALVDSVGGLPRSQSFFSLLRRGLGDGIQIPFKGCDRRLNCGIRESALTFGVSPLLGLDLDSIGLTERFFNRRSYCTQIRLKLLRKGACRASYSFMRRAKEIRGLLMRETSAAMGGISEMLPSAQSSFVRILMVLHERAGLCFWISAPVGFYNELVVELVRGSTLYNVSLWHGQRP